MTKSTFKKNIKRIFYRAKRVFINNSSSKSSIRILMYHSVGGNPEDHRLAIRVPFNNFKDQIHEIKKDGSAVVTVSEAIKRLSVNLSEKFLVITFDDGFKDNIISAAPGLNGLNLKATFFITTGLIDGRIKKHWTNGLLREYMDWNDIINLSAMGYEIGSHMLGHRDLRALNNQDLIKELRGSKEVIEDRIQKPVRVFSYPYGGVNKKVVEAARNVGYIGGCSSLRGLNFYNSDPLLLKRTEIDGFDTIGDFRSKLDGLYD